MIRADVLDARQQSRELQCNFFQGKGKKLISGGQPLERMSEHIGEIPLVAVLPSDTNLITGASADRRRFMDMLISQYSPAYLRHLIDYERILAQRNAQLRLSAGRGGYNPEELDLWTTHLIPHGIAILKARMEFLTAWLPVFREYFQRIVSRSEKPEISYQSQIEDNSLEGWLRLMNQWEARDRVNQYSGAGIHRDDLSFSINGLPVRAYGSQGQQKTFVIALKLAQYTLLQQYKGVPPILLLDDIFDKLDEQRLGSIGRILHHEIEGQTFITDTSAERLAAALGDHELRETRFSEVRDSQVTPIKKPA